LKTYKELYGDLRVPKAFIVPKDDSTWPEGLWNLKLGNIVSNIRSNDGYADHREELVAMGFDFNTRKSSRSRVVKKGGDGDAS
jgi:hypothetical protein